MIYTEWFPPNSCSDRKFKEKYTFGHHTTGVWIYYVIGLQKLYVKDISSLCMVLKIIIKVNDNCHFAIVLYLVLS